jgi:hypothetical protein
LKCPTAGCSLLISLVIQRSGSTPIGSLNRVDTSTSQSMWIVDAKTTSYPSSLTLGASDALLDYVPKAKQARDILLFARSSTSSKFVFCGSCSCAGWTSGQGLYDVVLELRQYEELMASTESPFRHMWKKKHENKATILCPGRLLDNRTEDTTIRHGSRIK